MDICYPLLVLTPNLDHGRCWLQTLVEDTDGTITESSHEDIAGNLIGCQGSDA